MNQSENQHSARPSNTPLTTLMLVQTIAVLLMLLLVAVTTIRIFKTLPKVDGVLAELDTGIEQVNAISLTLTEVDFITMADSITELAVTGSEDLNTAMGQLDETLIGAQEALNKLNKIDIDTLNRSIVNLSKLIDPLANLFVK